MEKSIFPKFEVIPFRKIGHTVVRALSWNMHQLSDTSDHKFPHDEPVCIPEDVVIKSVPDIQGREL